MCFIFHLLIKLPVHVLLFHTSCHLEWISNIWASWTYHSKGFLVKLAQVLIQTWVLIWVHRIDIRSRKFLWESGKHHRRIRVLLLILRMRRRRGGCVLNFVETLHDFVLHFFSLLYHSAVDSGLLLFYSSLHPQDLNYGLSSTIVNTTFFSCLNSKLSLLARAYLFDGDCVFTPYLQKLVPQVIACQSIVLLVWDDTWHRVVIP